MISIHIIKQIVCHLNNVNFTCPKTSTYRSTRNVDSLTANFLIVYFLNEDTHNTFDKPSSVLNKTIHLLSSCFSVWGCNLSTPLRKFPDCKMFKTSACVRWNGRPFSNTHLFDKSDMLWDVNNLKVLSRTSEHRSSQSMSFSENYLTFVFHLVRLGFSQSEVYQYRLTGTRK